MIERALGKIKIWHLVVFAACLYALNLNGLILSHEEDASWYVLESRRFLLQGPWSQFISIDPSVTLTYYRLFSLLLVPFAAFSPEGFLPMKLIALASTLAAIIVINKLLKGQIQEPYRKMVIILFAVSPWVIEYSGKILTEMPYILFSTCALLFAKRYEEDNNIRTLALLLIFFALSFYMRPNGIMLLPVLFLVRNARKKFLPICALLLVILYPFLSRSVELFGQTFKYFILKKQYYSPDFVTSSPLQILYRAAYNLTAYLGNYLPDMFIRPLVEWINPRLSNGSINPMFLFKFASGVLFAAVIFTGFIKGFRIKKELHHWYVIFQLILFLPMNVYVSRRLLVILPFLLFYFFQGLECMKQTTSLWHKPGFKGVPSAGFVFAALFFISTAGGATQIVASRSAKLEPAETQFRGCLDWVKHNAPKDAVILTRKSSFTRLYTGRDAPFNPVIINSVEEELRYLFKEKINYVIVSSDWNQFVNADKLFLEAAKQHPDKLKLVYETSNVPRYYVYQVIF